MTTAAERRRIAVIGAGVVGASVAHHLARGGAEVLIVEAERSASGVTKDSFAWIGLAATAPNADHAALRRLASADLDRLADELPLPFDLRRDGALTWGTGTGTGTGPDSASTSGALPPSVRIVDEEEIRRLEPNLLVPPRSAVLAERDGSVDPVALTHSLLRGAQQSGAVLLAETRVREVLTSRGRVVGLRTSAGTVDVDTVVLAAGTGTTALAATAGAHVAVDTSPCILLRLRTPERLVNRIVSGPDFEIRQAGDTLLLAAEDYIDGSDENGPDAVAQRTLAAIRRGIAGSPEITLSRVAVGIRPVPADGRPVIGSTATSGLYVVSAHAAVALAAGIGRLAAEEILGGQTHEILESFRPGRALPE